MKIQEAIRQVQESGKTCANHERITEIIEAVWTPNACLRQGDVVLHQMEPTELQGLKPTKERQLAPGTSKGSRHILEGDVNVFAYAGTDPLEGPRFLVGPGGATVTHPEHRHYMFHAGACGRVRYEQDLDAAERARQDD